MTTPESSARLVQSAYGAKPSLGIWCAQGYAILNLIWVNSLILFSLLLCSLMLWLTSIGQHLAAGSRSAIAAAATLNALNANPASRPKNKL